MHLQRIGIWAHELRLGEESVRREAATLLEELGYGTLWFPGSGGDDSLACARVLLDATERVAVATGITNIWTENPVEVAAEHADLAKTYDHRFVLGLGISHRHFVNSLGVVRFAHDHTLLYDNRVILKVKDGKLTWDRSLRTDSLG